MFFRSGVRLSAVGLVLGLPPSIAGLLLVTSTITPMPKIVMPLVIAAVGVAGAVIGVASLATWLPARKAATVDPLVAMRTD